MVSASARHQWTMRGVKPTLKCHRKGLLEFLGSEVYDGRVPMWTVLQDDDILNLVMRITLRLILALVFAAAVVVFVSTGFQARQEQVRLEEELRRRANVLAESLQESVEPLVASENLDGLRRLVQRFGDRPVREHKTAPAQLQATS